MMRIEVRRDDDAYPYFVEGERAYSAEDVAEMLNALREHPSEIAPSYTERLRLKLLELCDRLDWRGASREENLNITVREARTLAAETNAAPQGSRSSTCSGNQSAPVGAAPFAPSAERESTDANEARRYRRLKDASGRTWDKLAGDHITGQLDNAIDCLGDDE